MAALVASPVAEVDELEVGDVAAIAIGLEIPITADACAAQILNAAGQATSKPG